MMSRMSWPMMAAFVAMGVIALMLISGPWSPRVVEKDAAGEVVGGPPRPLAPGTPITTAPVPAEVEAVVPNVHDHIVRHRKANAAPMVAFLEPGLIAIGEEATIRRLPE